MKIAIIGCGYVGLVTGACLADIGHQVTSIDSDADRIALLRQGQMPIFEPGLDGLVAANVAAGRLAFTTELATPVAQADVVFIAVGTPSRRGDGYADVSYVHKAARDLAPHLGGFTVVATKSTVPVGTGDAVARILGAERPDADVAVVANPEFLREGDAIADFRRPDRVVIGAEDARARVVMEAVYQPLEAPLLVTGRRTAELVKYAANAFLAMKVSFINEIADLCEATGADVGDVARGMGLDPRIGARFLAPGPGYGGSCFPKDTSALIRIAQDAGSPLRLVEATVAVNERRREAMADRVVAACGGDVRGKTIAVLGLTFKPGTDDLRESPALDIVRSLVERGARIVATDPQGMPGARRVLPGIGYADDAYAAAAGADAAVLVTEWDAFRQLDLSRLAAAMRAPVLVDLRNVYSHDEAVRHGLAYFSLGRPAPGGAAGAAQAAE